MTYYDCTFDNITSSTDGLLWIMSNAEARVRVEECSFSRSTVPRFSLGSRTDGEFFGDARVTDTVRVSAARTETALTPTGSAQELSVQPPLPSGNDADFVQLQHVRLPQDCISAVALLDQFA